MKTNHIKYAGFILACAAGTPAFAQSACEVDRQLTIVSATDEGLYEETHGPENTIDGNLDPDSRWSSESQGGPRTLLLDLGAQQTLSALDIAWYKGDTRRSTFSVETSTDGETYVEAIAQVQTGGTTVDFERFEAGSVDAQFVRLVGVGNESNNWNSRVCLVSIRMYRQARTLI